MSVIVMGMEMPKNCKECPFSDREAWCLIPGDWRERYYCPDDERSDDCPLIEIPPHGRLIDADAVNRKMDERVETLKDDASIYEASCVAVALEMFAPTVIEAED